MNIKKIKMALTIGLMKNADSANLIQTLKDMMQNFREEIGTFLGQQELAIRSLNANHVQHSYAIQFERCTLNVDLINNPHTNVQVVKSFNVH